MLVDTAIWIDHRRGSDPVLVELLEQARVSVHPFIVGEVACGNLTERAAVLESMEALPMLPVLGGRLVCRHRRSHSHAHAYPTTN